MPGEAACDQRAVNVQCSAGNRLADAHKDCGRMSSRADTKPNERLYKEMLWKKFDKIAFKNENFFEHKMLQNYIIFTIVWDICGNKFKGKRNIVPELTFQEKFFKKIKIY